ncbi:CBO0543 family protein [Paenibacillus sp. FSL R5-0490]|uniref:CBO0543 family protein n=1 Tax=Paenibacillus sp. FSL R5-0490 TaxID=1920424 RepID=UPI0025707B7B|nr:CBO0543 family protein [Paenibacillus sp. FSL R5-0490]
MHTVKHLKGSSSQPLPKRPSGIKAYIPAMLLASLLGTYLDLYFTGKGMYSFPIRPFSGIFTINILFTLAVLPIFMIPLLKIMESLKGRFRGIFVLAISIAMAAAEKIAESLGMFVHAENWHHLYTFTGYCLFIGLIAVFHGWMNGNR